MMPTIPNLLDRYTNQTHFSIKNDPNTLRYLFKGHRTLDGAFAGGVDLFVVERDTVYKSPSIRRKGWGVIDESKRGQTRVWFDLDDFQPTDPANLPRDDEFAFLTVEEYNVALGGYLPVGPIYVLPPAEFFGVTNSTISLFGTAPAGTGATAGEKPPAGTMRIALPIYSSGLFLRNLGTVDLLVSFGAGMPLVPVPTTSDRPFFEIDTGTVSELFLAADDAGTTAAFAFYFTLAKT